MGDERKTILLGGNASGEQLAIDAGMANRHGLITGATGTGKTVSLQVLAEAFSRLGVPVFTADVKGDLSGLAKPGKPHKNVTERLEHIGIGEHPFEGCPVLFWDVYGKKGHPVRTTVSEMGPVLLANLLELNETQSGILYVAFSIADDQGLLLLDLKDLRAMLNWMAEHRKELNTEYGGIATQSISAIQRRLLVLQDSGGEEFFGEPALNIQDLMQADFSGRGVISLLDATTLYQNPRIYATFLLWLLSELMAELPERGDAALPKLVFFFDEAHLLFDSAPKALLERITQVVRLIRSKGVGVFFVSQYPNDVPDEVLGQLGSRIQHALRAYTPKDRKAVRVAAQTFRQNPEIDTEEMIIQLGVGEALISTLDEKGRPTMVDWCLMAPPRSRFGPATKAERDEIFGRSPLKGRYDNAVDRDSAYEMLTRREQEMQQQRELAAEEEALRKQLERATKKPRSRSRRRQTSGESFLNSLARSAGTQIGRTIIRGILGAISGRR
ncbi:MAG: helicase HerA-like domain-containing protein [Pseudomonadota bacterium]